jgi:hypothetical protein
MTFLTKGICGCLPIGDLHLADVPLMCTVPARCPYCGEPLDPFPTNPWVTSGGIP